MKIVNNCLLQLKPPVYPPLFFFRHLSICNHEGRIILQVPKNRTILYQCLGIKGPITETDVMGLSNCCLAIAGWCINQREAMHRSILFLWCVCSLIQAKARASKCGTASVTGLLEEGWIISIFAPSSVSGFENWFSFAAWLFSVLISGK